MRNMAVLYIASFVLSAILASHSVSAQDACFKETPLPKVLPSLAVDDGIPSNLARFVGVWGNGKWGGNLCTTLVAGSMDKQGKATVIYSWGTYPEWYITENGFWKTTGTIKDGVRILPRSDRGADISFRFEDGALHGKFVRGNTSLVTLTKIK